MRPRRPGVVAIMWIAALLGGSLLTAHAARPPDVTGWLEAACESGKERAHPVLVALPAASRAPSRVGPLAVELRVDPVGVAVDGTPVAEDALLDAIGRAYAGADAALPAALVVDRTVPAAELVPVLRALHQLPPRPLVVLLHSQSGTPLPDPPDPGAASARELQVAAILAGATDPLTRVHAMNALAPHLAVPTRTCPELDVALRSPASALPDCAAAAADVAAVLGRCHLDEAGTRRAATITGLSWAPPEVPPVATLPVRLDPAGRALEGTWEDVVNRLLDDDEALLAVP